MIIAKPEDKALVVDILSNSFDDNKSVNYVVRKDRLRQRRISRLMDYSFEYCRLFGVVYLSEDKKACALTLLPDKKRTTLRSIILDLKLAFSCVGLANIQKVLAREAKITAIYPPNEIFYMWCIGVQPVAQNAGVGSALLKEVIEKSELMRRPVYLETSTLKNVPWYKKFGFIVYDQLDFGFTLFCLKRENCMAG